MKKATVIVSGGLDSVVLAHYLASLGISLHVLSFNYGQRHQKEIAFAMDCAHRLKAEFDLIDLSTTGPLLRSALTDTSIPVPAGDYNPENMSVTVVPNRNAIFLSIAFGVAVSDGAEGVFIGIHSGDHHLYPDCRPAFIKAFNAMEKLSNNGGPQLYAPFSYLSKSGIVRVGADLEVPFQKTWSCYNGKEIHCEKCGTCRERQEAFSEAKIHDPTRYSCVRG